MKIVTIVGARPQFIKAAVVSRALLSYPEIEEVMVHTGQHFDDNMSKVFFEELEIPEPRYHLGIHSLQHGSMTGRMIEKIESVLIKERPDWVVVYGDTNSTLAGALAARKLYLPLAHVEAGMRSYSWRSPEEINRIVADRLANLLLCSTKQAVQNVRYERLDRFGAHVVRTGDVMFDAALYYSQKPKSSVPFFEPLLPASFALCTLHREENVEDPQRFQEILQALLHIHEEIPVVMPVHPRTRQKLNGYNGHLPFVMLDPVGYLDMLELLRRCSLVLTDSGGLQKEAFFFRRYCITLRDETEWTELVTLGVNKLAGANARRILKAFRSLYGKKMKVNAQPYGKGKAGERIVKALLKYRCHAKLPKH